MKKSWVKMEHLSVGVITGVFVSGAPIFYGYILIYSHEVVTGAHLGYQV